MPRRKTQFYSGGIYHILNRGAFKHQVFDNENHCRMFKSLLKKYSEKFHITILAYCIMPNHFHLVIRQDGKTSVSLFMQLVAHGFARYYNRAEMKTGVVFQARFQSIPVTDDSYLYSLVSYIHLNPVKASLCKHPKDWNYSNFNAFIGVVSDSITDPVAVHDLFGDLTLYKGVLAINLEKLTHR
jgi:putative transposase